MTKKAANKAEKAHMAAVAELGCCVCGRFAEVHHITTGVGMGQRSSHYDTIPLCPDHHRNGGHGVAIHAGKATFEQEFGLETELLQLVRWHLGIVSD